MKYIVSLAALALLAAPVQAQLVVNTDLGVLGVGSTNITGDTTGGVNNASNYPPFTNPAVTWLEEVVFQFTTTSELGYQLINNSIAGDPDFFLLDSLGVTFDGTHNNADSVLAADFLDGGANGDALTIPAGTYYISVDAYGGLLPGDSAANLGAFDIDLVLSPPDIVSALGNLPLDDGFYARSQTGDADHPYGQLAFSVDVTGDYDILGEWFDPAGGAFDGYLYLFDSPFAENDSTNIALDDDFGGTAQSLIEGVTLNAGQTYYLVGTTFGGQAGNTILSGDITVFGPGTASVIPEPTSIMLSLLAVAGLVAFARRK